jgi:TetR/AcrR family transcriptional regulator
MASVAVDRRRAVKNVRIDDDGSRRERILLAAVERFADKGFAAVRIDEIAADAEANKQLIYYYFSSKAELYDAVLEHMVTAMAKVWDSLASAPSLEAALWRMQDWDELGTTWCRLLAWEGLEYTGRDRLIHLEGARTRSWSRWVEIVTRAQVRGELRADLDPQMFALLLISVTSLSVVLPQVAKMISGEDPDSADFRQRQATLISTLLSALKPCP